jgi:hypothetical protein
MPGRLDYRSLLRVRTSRSNALDVTAGPRKAANAITLKPYAEALV